MMTANGWWQLKIYRLKGRSLIIKAKSLMQHAKRKGTVNLKSLRINKGK
jgi:hypothetical protein